MSSQGRLRWPDWLLVARNLGGPVLLRWLLLLRLLTATLSWTEKHVGSALDQLSKPLFSEADHECHCEVCKPAKVVIEIRRVPVA